jgi:hypothetical protein
LNKYLNNDQYCLYFSYDLPLVPKSFPESYITIHYPELKICAHLLEFGRLSHLACYYCRAAETTTSTVDHKNGIKTLLRPSGRPGRREKGIPRVMKGKSRPTTSCRDPLTRPPAGRTTPRVWSTAKSCTHPLPALVIKRLFLALEKNPVKTSFTFFYPTNSYCFLKCFFYTKKQ